MKRQVLEWQKIFAGIMSNKGLASKDTQKTLKAQQFKKKKKAT